MNYEPTSPHVKADKFGEYLIGLFNLQPLIDIHPNLAWHWMWAVVERDFSMATQAYDEDRFKYLGCFERFNDTDDEKLLEWITQNGYGYVTDIHDSDEPGAYFVWNQPLPATINQLDLNVKY